MPLTCPTTGLTDMCTCPPNFDIGAGDLNTGLHVCTAARTFSLTLSFLSALDPQMVTMGSSHFLGLVTLK